MKKLLSMFMVAILYFPGIAAVRDKIPADECTEAGVSTDGSITIKSGGFVSYNGNAAVIFEAEIKESGLYYVNGWLDVPQISDGTLPSYKITVNDKYIGDFTPQSEGLQSVCADSEPIPLSNGKSEILVYSEHYGVPSIEAVKLSRTREEMAFSSQAYDEYKQKTSNRIGRESDRYDNFAQDVNSDVYLTQYYREYENIPVKYSFYVIKEFAKGQDVTIKTSSAAKHSVDMFIVGLKDGPVLRDSANLVTTSNLEYAESSSLSGGVITGKIKNYNPPTDEMTRGLHWHAESILTNNGSNDSSELKATITVSGMYFIRVRTSGNGISALADIEINGSQLYADRPIYNSSRITYLAHDGREYRYTVSDIGQCDPMLFVESSRGSRIIGYADDGAGKAPVLTQSYNVLPITAQFSNYSSIVPEGTCSLRIEDLSNTEKQIRTKTNTSNIYDVNRAENVVTPNPANLSGNININCPDTISEIFVFSISGNLLANVKVGNQVIDIPLKDLNIHESGMYLLTVFDVKGKNYSTKLIVK